MTEKIDFDVICVGSGPANLFAALELTKLCPGIRIAIFEKGSARTNRKTDSLTSGLGGAGTFSDGKLTMPNSEYPRSFNVGGQLASIIGENQFMDLVNYIDQTYVSFGGSTDLYPENAAEIKRLVEKAAISGLQLTPTRVRHFGSDIAPRIIANIAEELKKRGVMIFLESPAISLTKNNNIFSVETGGENAGLFRSRYIIAAPGREGAEWLTSQAEILGFEMQPRQTGVDIGVRVEVPAHILSPLTDYLYDPKIEYYPDPSEDKVRTFCVCPYGEVVVEKYENLLTTVNGHSFHNTELSQNTNFALLVSVNFTEPFKEPLEYARAISELVNKLSGGGVLVQRLGDLRKGKRSKPEKMARGLVRPSLLGATPGDLGFAIPHRHLVGILKMLETLDKLVPGVNGADTLLYGAEVKFYSNRVTTSPDLESTLEGFFVAGDGAGITRGLIQSSASGVIAARTIAERMKTGKKK